MTELRVLDLLADKMEAEVVVAFYFEDQRPVEGPAALLDWRLNGFLTALLKGLRATGKAGEHILTPNNGKVAADRVFFVGGGCRKSLGKEAYGGLIRHAVISCLDAGFSRIALCLDPLEGSAIADSRQMVSEVLKSLEIEKFKCSLSFEGPSPR